MAATDLRRATPRPACTRSRRTTSRRRTTVLAIVAGTVLLAACSMTDAQFTAYDLVNRERTTRGGAILLPDETAQAKAQAWAEHLAANNTLSHSDLTAGMDGGWTKLAENVGSGSSIGAVHEQFMRSSTHRANILDGSLTHLGTGVARAHGKTWVVQVFSRR